jgi:hypothetical protein
MMTNFVYNTKNNFHGCEFPAVMGILEMGKRITPAWLVEQARIHNFEIPVPK